MQPKQKPSGHVVLIAVGIVAAVLWMKYGHAGDAPISDSSMEKRVVEVFRGHKSEAREYAGLYHGLSLLSQSEHVRTTAELAQATLVGFEMLGHKHGEIQGLSQVVDEYLNPVAGQEKELDRSLRNDMSRRFDELSKACLRAAGG